MFFWNELWLWIHRYMEDVYKNNERTLTISRGDITCKPKFSLQLEPQYRTNTCILFGLVNFANYSLHNNTKIY